MKRIAIGIALILGFLLLPSSVIADRSAPLIIDHMCTDLSLIPANWIEQAKSLIKWHYAHTSHGGQLTTGLDRIQRQNSSYSFSRSTSTLPNTSGALCILDGMRPVVDDSYITPDKYFSSDWEAPYYAHTLLNTSQYSGVINVSAFSWCTQMNSGGNSSLVGNYLQAMTQLEQANPDVTFIYMTGNAQCGPDNHYCSDLDAGYRRYLRNEQIRAYCRENNKVLFDFADIDSWWFNSQTSEWEQATYAYQVGGDTIHVPYEHPQYNLNQAAHTSNENCENKGKAVWQLMARLAGWGDCIEAPSGLSAEEDSPNQEIVLSWTDNSTDTNEDSFIIQRQVNDGSWDNAYASVGADITTFTDSGLAVGSYQYRVAAHQDNSGDGNPCESGSSNEASAEIITQDDTDSDGDGVPDNLDGCPNNGDKTEPGICGCDKSDIDSDGDGIADCHDQCPQDAGKTAPGQCGCGVADVDTDSDGVAGCNDGCDNDPEKIEPGACGCGVPDTDGDNDGTPDCSDQCPEDPEKTSPGQCGCGITDTDTCNNRPLPPVLIAPANASSGISLSPTISADGFNDPDNNDVHDGTIWQISPVNDFTELVCNETTQDHLTSFTPSEPLKADTTYFWRASYIDNRGAQSEWSEVFSFTTRAQDQTPKSLPDEDGGDINSDGINSTGCFIGITGL